MQTKRSPGRLAFLYVVVFLFLILAASLFWILPGRYTAQLIQAIENNTSIECLPVSIDYSPVTGRMVLEKPELRISPGITLTADEINFSVNWASLWTDTDNIELKDITVIRPHISIDRYLLGRRGAINDLRLFLSSVGRFEFQDGLLSLNMSATLDSKEQLTISFNDFVLDTADSDRFKLRITGNQPTGKAATQFKEQPEEDNQWQFEGIVLPDDVRVNGQLSLSQVPLQSMFDAGYLTCDNCMLNGFFNADLSMEWGKDIGLELEGTATAVEGRLTTADGTVLDWENLIVEDYQFARKLGSVKNLTVQGGRLVFSQDDYLPQLHSLFQVQLNNAVERIVFAGAVHSLNGTEFIKPLRGVIDFDKGAEVFSYQASGLWNESVPFTAEGQFDSAKSKQNRLKLQARDIDFSKLEPRYRKSGVLDLSGSQARLTLDIPENSGNGTLVFDRFMSDSGSSPSETDFSRLKGVLVGPKGRVIVSVRPRIGAVSFPCDINRSMTHFFSFVLSDIPGYLAKVTRSKPLEFDIQMGNVQGKLTDIVRSELDNWVVVLKQRPLLGLSVSTPDVAKRAVYQYFQSRGIDKQRIVMLKEAPASGLNSIKLKLLFP